MKIKCKKLLAVLLSACLAVPAGAASAGNGAKAARLSNVVFGRENTTYLISNANNNSEGFCYPGHGFSSIQVCNENYSNANNMLGRTASTDDGVDDVLFIGNSMTYYNNLSKVVQGIAARKGHSIECSAATNGGQNLIFQSTAANVTEAVKKGGYETVVLQDIVGSFDADNLRQGAQALIAKVKSYSPDAKILFYEPWPTKDTILGENSLLPYFTHSYIETAKSFGASLAPAGEAFYHLYNDSKLDYYCGDNKHPQPLGTFTSASTIYHAMYPEEALDAFTADDQAYLDKLINDNVAFTDEGKQDTYSLDTLNLIFSLGYEAAHAVAGAVDGTGTFTSAAGEYKDWDAEANPQGLPPVEGVPAENGAFTESGKNLAAGCKSYASSGDPLRGTDGDVNTRWESDWSDPQWLYVDLGTEKDFDTAGFIWEGAYGAKYYIQISSDAGSWETVAFVRASEKGTVQIPLGRVFRARYVRMFGTKRGTIYGYSFYEMGVWRTGEEESTAAQTQPETTEPETADAGQTQQQTTAVGPSQPESTEAGPTQSETADVGQTQQQTTAAGPSQPESTKPEITDAGQEGTAAQSAQNAKKPAQTQPEVTLPDAGNTGAQGAGSVTGREAGRAKIVKAFKKEASKKIRISLKKKVRGAYGYQLIFYKTKKTAKRDQKPLARIYYKGNRKKFPVSVRKIKNRKILYVRARAYILDGHTRVYGRLSAVKKVRVRQQG